MEVFLKVDHESINSYCMELKIITIDELDKMYPNEKKTFLKSSN